MVLPLASSLTHSVNFADLVVWGAIALVVQLAAYGTARLPLPAIAGGIASGNVARGVFLGALSNAVGMLNAASMS